MALNKTFKKKWIKALRAGGLHQTTGYLRKKKIVNDEKVDAFCCLGVACNILRPNLWTIAKDIGDRSRPAYAIRMNFGYSEKENAEIFEFCDKSGKTLNYMPKALADKIGLTVKQQAKLGQMNDGGKTFAEIADYIEKNL